MSTNITVAIIAIIAFLILMFLGTPVPVSMAITGFFGFAALRGMEASMQMVSQEVVANFSSYTMSIAPMFAMMGFAAYYSGLGSRIFTACEKFMGHYRGGLAMATALACTFFGAICGSAPATVGTMGAVAYPEMKQRGYHPKLSCCTIAVGSSIAVLIPPSLSFVIYGNASNTSVGHLFLSGVIPGILLAVATIVCIIIMGKIDPNIAPKGPKYTMKERFRTLAEGGLIEIIIVFAFSIGGMFIGWFAPTEAGAIGSAAMILLCVVRRKLTWKDFWRTMYDTAKLTVMVFLILSCAAVFSRFIAVTTIAAQLATVIKASSLSGPAVVALLFVFLFIMGMLTDVLSIVLLIIPIIFPILVDFYGYSPLWFGNVTLLMTCIGGLSPPVGIGIFLVKACIKDPSVTLKQIFSGAWYFIAATVVVLIIITLLPQTCTWLPSIVYG